MTSAKNARSFAAGVIRTSICSMARRPGARHPGSRVVKGMHMRAALIAGGCLAISYCLIAAALFLLQRRILFRPDRPRPGLPRIVVPGLREVTVTTPDGLSLLCWYLPPRGTYGRGTSGRGADDRVVLYLHGNAGHIGHRAFRLGLYHSLGWGVLLLGYRGFGGNPGRPSEAGLLIDARAGLAAIRDMGFSPDRILLWGESLGSGVAVSLAAEQTVAAVLLEAPYTSITDMGRRRFPFVPVRWLLLDRFDSLRTIRDVHSPVMVMHGARDRIIPVEMGRAVFDAANEPKELWIAVDAGHVDLVEAGAIEAAGAFVEKATRA
jgi:fermentation-respiration switch protein FrsA (DUF1100 family)